VYLDDLFRRQIFLGLAHIFADGIYAALSFTILMSFPNRAMTRRRQVAAHVNKFPIGNSP
jgi:hypothetical protein